MFRPCPPRTCSGRSASSVGRCVRATSQCPKLARRLAPPHYLVTTFASGRGPARTCTTAAAHPPAHGVAPALFVPESAVPCVTSRTHVYVIYRRMCEPCRSLHEGCTERCGWRRAVKTRAMSPLSHSAFSVSVVGRALNGTFLVLTNIIYSQAVAQHSLEKLNKKKNATTHMVDHTQDPTH